MRYTYSLGGLWMLPVLTVLCLSAPNARAVPSFARQTGMACAACHTVFPELTPFGREFKLNGYVMDNIKQITGIDTQNRQTLSLNSIPPLSVMLQVSYTHTGAALPDSAVSGVLAKDGDVLFPQQASLFYAGKIADNFGAFMQLTYDGAGDHFGFDNTDLRYARHFDLGGDSDPKAHTLIVGVTVNNNPTVQDAWNSTPAWGFPYSGSNTAPTPGASAKIDSGGLGQSVAGAGVYAWFDSSLYAELSLYTSAITGGAHPLDSTQGQVAHGANPYWRLAYEHRWDRNSLEVGTYGIVAKVHPGNGMPLQGPTDQFSDTALDAQYQFIGEDHLFTVLSTYIHENQKFNASFLNTLASNPSNTLKTFRLVGEYYYQRKIGGTLAYFDISGSSDALLYPQAPVGGSANGKPDSSGILAELNYLPWLNTKLQLQYTHYDKFNGGNSNYDGAGRNASNNDTLYMLGWINF